MYTDTSSAAHLVVVDDFFDAADSMRALFDERMGDVRRVFKDRFVWDYWHVPDQYTYLRTPARDYLPQAQLQALLKRLREWGKSTLGCEAVTVPWLSYYLDGCHQALHTDVPHGPWAYVLSLTHWEGRGFGGGETMLAQPALLDYWRHFAPAHSVEQDALLRCVSPRFNRLVVFDPRIPHGVRDVRGSRDPLDSRVVLHGWFSPPRITVEGEGDRRGLAAEVRTLIDTLSGDGRFHTDITGLMVARLAVNAQGDVTSLRLLTDNLVHRRADAVELDELRGWLVRQLESWRFGGPGSPHDVLLPLSFPRSPSRA